MSFRLQFGGITVVRSPDTLAKVNVDGTYYNRFANLLDEGSSHTISQDSAQLTPNGKTQYVWNAWSDGGLRTHMVTGHIAGDSITATDCAKYKLQVTIAGTGTVASSPAVNHTAGVFLAKNTTETMTATAGSGNSFYCWSGDAKSAANPLNLTMTRPFVLTSAFAAPLAITSGAPTGPVMGKTYSFAVTTSGGYGTTSWQVTNGALPSGLSLSPSTGVVSGVPSQAGNSSATVQVTSCAHTVSTTLSFTVTEPTLALTSVLNQLLGISSSLSTDDITYLDLLGNNDSKLDVSDFLGWVNHNQISPAPPARQAVQAAGGEGRAAP